MYVHHIEFADRNMPEPIAFLALLPPVAMLMFLGGRQTVKVDVAGLTACGLILRAEPSFDPIADEDQLVFPLAHRLRKM